jgi:energy-converting hydrogenase A subunit M
MKQLNIKQEIIDNTLKKIKRLFPAHLKTSYEKWREDVLKELDKLNYK